MAPRARPRPTSATAIRFEPKLHADLTKAAEERGLSLNFLVNEAVRLLLPRLADPDEYRAALIKKEAKRA